MDGGVWIWRGVQTESGVESPSAMRQPSSARPDSQRRAQGQGAEQAAVLLWPCSDLQAAIQDNGAGQEVLYSGALPLLQHRELPDGVWLLNAGAATMTELDETGLAARLRAAGIGWGALQDRGRLQSADRPGRRLYRVAVFHLAIVQLERIGRMPSGAAFGAGKLWQADGQRGATETGLDEADPLYRRVARMAVRTLYALGLDFGAVVVALDDDGRTSVCSVKLPPCGPGLWQQAAERFALEYRAALTIQGRLLLGADPEFALLRADGRLASAARYLPPHGPVGCDAVPVGRQLRYPVAELRPAPAPDPAALASALRSLLQQAARRIGASGLRWLAGGMPVPGLALGGHLHLSGVPLTSRLLRALDSCVALPLALVEGAGARARRPRYGWLGDFRRQPHGGFEYRTPPSWLVSPAAARAAFALALLAAAEERTLAASPHVLPACDEALVAAYYAGDKQTLLRGMEPFFARLTATPGYSPLARWIEPLLEAAQRGEAWDETRDIRIKWRIPML